MECRDSVDLGEDFGAEHEVGGEKVFLELRHAGGAEDGRGDEVLLFAPRQTQGNEAEPDLGREHPQGIHGREALLVDEAMSHLALAFAVAGQVAGEAGAFGEAAVIVFAGADATAKRRVGQAGDFFAAADVGELVLEAAG